jgi:hypothetical protein
LDHFSFDFKKVAGSLNVWKTWGAALKLTLPTLNMVQIEDLRLQLDIREHECREHRVAAAAQASNAESRERSLAKVNALLAAMNAKVRLVCVLPLNA